jgi:translocation and assembly module TamA
MTLAQGLRAALAAVAVLALSGCANLPFLSGRAGPEAAADGASAPAMRDIYRLEVQAPGPLRKLLLNHLDLSRFQSAPVLDAIDDVEIERLMRAAPAQARGLLETEGFFNAEVTAARVGTATGPEGTELPLLRVVVEPGPQASVVSVSIEAIGDLPAAAAAGDDEAARELDRFRSQWPLRVGDGFRQAAWADARNSTLASLRAQGYASATWSSTHALVDATVNSVAVTVVADSGPRFRLGEIRIEGLERFDEDSVRRLANFGPGEPYTEKLLLDFQDRLQRIGLFEGASVVLDADVATAGAAPVLVRVREQTLQQATVGVGYSANTGARVSVEHVHRSVFGTRWAARNKIVLGPQEQSWEGDLSSHPLEGLYRNLVSGSASRLLADDQTQLSWNARVGRVQDTPRIERRYFVELTHARVDSDPLTSQGDAVSLNYQWVYRGINDLRLPTEGLTTSLQAAIGYSHGTQSVQNDPQIEARGPFTRLYARMTWYQRLGASWYGSARIEAGEVFTRNVIGVPDTLLFRAGGDESVRGYGYRELGPSIDGATTSGRNLLTTSVEIARPIMDKYPAYWWAAFIDAGNAADGWSNLKPALGYGVGLRWRSPVGPLRADLAYGQESQQVRFYLSVGVVF